MKQQLAAAVVALSMVGGVGTGVAAHALSSDGPSDKPTTSPTSAKTTTPAPKKAKTTPPPPQKTSTTPVKPVLQPVSTFQIFPGSVGPLKVGMSKDQALATGYVEAGVFVPSCGTAELQWKPDYKWALDVGTLDDGQIESIGVTRSGPRTRSGLQVGSTYASVKAVLGEGSAPEPTVQGKTAMYVSQGASWIGFLFDAAPDAVTDTTPVTYIEVRNGSKPNLTPGGC